MSDDVQRHQYCQMSSSNTNFVRWRHYLCQFRTHKQQPSYKFVVLIPPPISTEFYVTEFKLKQFIKKKTDTNKKVIHINKKKHFSIKLEVFPIMDTKMWPFKRNNHAFCMFGTIKIRIKRECNLDDILYHIGTDITLKMCCYMPSGIGNKILKALIAQLANCHDLGGYCRKVIKRKLYYIVWVPMKLLRDV